MEAGFGPDLVERGAGVGVDEIVRVAEGELVGSGGVTDELCGEAGRAELIEDGGGVFGADLDDGAELFGEESGKRRCAREVDLEADATGEGHLGERDEEAAVGAVVIGEQLVFAIELLDRVEEGEELFGLGRVGCFTAGEVVDLRERGVAETVAALLRSMRRSAPSG